MILDFIWLVPYQRLPIPVRRSVLQFRGSNLSVITPEFGLDRNQAKIYVDMPITPTLELLELLADSPLFRGIGPTELEVALGVAQPRRLSRGEFFFHQGEAAEAFFVMVEGRVRLCQITPEGHQVIIRFIGPSDGIGIIVALSNTVYPLSAEAVVDSFALRWNYDSIIKLMEQYPPLALNGMRLVAGRFQELQDRYRELATERVERRVARALLRLARQTGRRTDEGVLLDLPLSRQDLGEMTGTTLYTVSRILSSWEQQGFVQSGRERVVIQDPHGLVTIAEDLPKR